MPYKTYLNWSSGKDASLALYRLQQDPAYSIEKLVTTVNTRPDRVTMHGLRRKLLIAQTKATGLPLHIIELPEQPDMETYNQKMNDTVQQLKSEGFTHAGFGDIFLEDLKQYREEQLEAVGMNTVFPLWQEDTTDLIHEMIDLGFKTVVNCIDSRVLDQSFLGRTIDYDLLKDLPKNADPCGENGEFHTFCYDGPIFNHPVPFKNGETVYKEYPNPTDKEKRAGFWFLDLI